MNIFLKIFLATILFFALVKVYLVITDQNISEKTEHNSAGFTIEDFAKCLSERDLIMYGVDNCEYCQAQKKMFGSSFMNIKYINCAFDTAICEKEGVSQYPTWIYQGKKFLGMQNFNELNKITSCPLPFEY